MYAIILCGPAGAGKTTYVENHLPSHFLRLSTDDLIHREAARKGISYNECFEQGYYPTAEALFYEQMQHCFNRNLEFIVDQTNLTEASRKKKLSRIPKSFFKIGIYFPSYTAQVLHKRILAREAQGLHSVPFDVVEKMHKEYKLPQKTEGFDLIVSSSHFVDFLKGFEFK